MNDNDRELLRQIKRDQRERKRRLDDLQDEVDELREVVLAAPIPESGTSLAHPPEGFLAASSVAANESNVIARLEQIERNLGRRLDSLEEQISETRRLVGLPEVLAELQPTKAEDMQLAIEYSGAKQIMESQANRTGIYPHGWPAHVNDHLNQVTATEGNAYIFDHAAPSSGFFEYPFPEYGKVGSRIALRIHQNQWKPKMLDDGRILCRPSDEGEVAGGSGNRRHSQVKFVANGMPSNPFASGYTQSGQSYAFEAEFVIRHLDFNRSASKWINAFQLFGKLDARTWTGLQVLFLLDHGDSEHLELAFSSQSGSNGKSGHKFVTPEEDRPLVKQGDHVRWRMELVQTISPNEEGWMVGFVDVNQSGWKQIFGYAGRVGTDQVTDVGSRNITTPAVGCYSPSHHQLEIDNYRVYVGPKKPHPAHLRKSATHSG